MDRGMGMGMGMDRILGACIPGIEAAAAADREEGLELSLSLHPSPSSPPRFQAVFACCYCPRKFRSSQALGGHQNAHKLQRNLARRGREPAASAPPATPPPTTTHGPDHQQGCRASGGGGGGAPAPRSRAEPGAGAWGEGRQLRRQQQHFLYQRLQAGGAEASSGARGDGSEAAAAAEEIIDLSLKL